MDEFPKEIKQNICKDLLRMNYLQSIPPKLLITVYVTISEKS